MISGSTFRVTEENESTLLPPSNVSRCPLVQDPQIVLISYAKRYVDIARLIRLKFIAQVCPKLRVEALELAITQVKKTYNVKMYEELFRNLSTERERCVNVAVEEADTEQATSSTSHSSSSTTSGAPKPGRGGGGVGSSSSSSAHLYDAYWVEDNTMESTLLLQELDAELNFKKSNSGSAYVRRILEEIGDYHVKSGNLQLAVKFYARARPYCTSSDHVIHMFRNLIRVSIYMANWWHVLSYIDEAKQYALGYQNLEHAVPAQLSCAAGLANMGLKIYKTAAHCFLLTPYERYDYDRIVAPQDVAFYAGLCGLATLEPDMLQLGCINSEAFKPFFDLSPIMCSVLTKFLTNEIELCKQQLHDIESRIRLDVYLAPHVDTLYNKIMDRLQDRRHSASFISVDSSAVGVQDLAAASRESSVYFSDAHLQQEGK